MNTTSLNVVNNDNNQNNNYCIKYNIYNKFQCKLNQLKIFLRHQHQDLQLHHLLSHFQDQYFLCFLYLCEKTRIYKLLLIWPNFRIENGYVFGT